MKHLNQLILFAVALLLCALPVRAQLYLDTKAPIEQRVEDALSRMTLAE